jgi:hypothetical protein
MTVAEEAVTKPRKRKICTRFPEINVSANHSEKEFIPILNGFFVDNLYVLLGQKRLLLKSADDLIR